MCNHVRQSGGCPFDKPTVTIMNMFVGMNTNLAECAPTLKFTVTDDRGKNVLCANIDFEVKPEVQ